MDPLGARPNILTAEEIPRWGTEESNLDPLTSTSFAISIIGPELPNVHSNPPFTIRPDLNEKIALW